MNILVTGANGQLAKCLKDVVEKNGNGHADSFVGEKDYWIFADRNELDITNMDAVDEYVSKRYINVIVNCAAYTNVAKAEDDYNVPYSANVCGSEILANACKRNGAVLIHIREGGSQPDPPSVRISSSLLLYRESIPYPESAAVINHRRRLL